MKSGISLSPKQQYDQTIYCRKQKKRKLKEKTKMLQEKCIMHEAIKI
jgi:hypothetical protein